MKIVLMLFISTLSLSAFAQQKTQKPIEKAMFHPKAADNSARADVLLIDQKKIMDSSSIIPAKPPRIIPRRKYKPVI